LRAENFFNSKTLIPLAINLTGKLAKKPANKFTFDARMIHL